MPEPVLCYVDGPWAYFTTQNLKDQWGDDWNDVPYEHNASPPYEYDKEHNKDKQPWEIIKVAWDGDLQTPCNGMTNSRYSVEGINAGKIAWLASSEYSALLVAIPAGTTLQKFIELVKKAGGNVYSCDKDDFYIRNYDFYIRN